MFRTLESMPALFSSGAMTLIGRQMPDRILIAYRLISLLRSRPVIGEGRNGLGREYHLLKYRNQSFYLGYLDDQSRQLLVDLINRRWPEQQIRRLTGLRKELRRKATRLAVPLGFRFRGHEIRRMR
jgi:hypothetical protein